jgi:hypothetical protein
VNDGDADVVNDAVDVTVTDTVRETVRVVVTEADGSDCRTAYPTSCSSTALYKLVVDTQAAAERASVTNCVEPSGDVENSPYRSGSSPPKYVHCNTAASK